MKIPRIVLAGTHSGVGKTTITTGLLSALTRQGLKVQAYKVGPDYIDPSYHTAATGRPCRNLDTWMLGSETVTEIFDRTSQDADIAVIEGVMGLFDGASAVDETGSTAEVAKLVDARVILILDVKSMARSAAALVLGFKALDPELHIAGVILNRIGSERHYKLVKEAIEHYTGLPVLGAIKKNQSLVMPERHLGLVPVVESSSGFVPMADNSSGSEPMAESSSGSVPMADNSAGHVPITDNKSGLAPFQGLADIVEESLDLAKILEAAGFTGNERPALSGSSTDSVKLSKVERLLIIKMPEQALDSVINSSLKGSVNKVPIAIAKDEAFSFYYQDSLDLLESAGARLIPFSPLHDRELPKGVGAIYIGGGFPELYLPQLAQNHSMPASLRNAQNQGMPIYAECGGYMYLSREIIDFEGRAYKACGIIPASSKMQKRLVSMGYTIGEALGDNLLLQKGEQIRGHEFHYSNLIPEIADFPWAFNFHKKTTGVVNPAGYSQDNVLASYLHINFAANPQLAWRFTAKAREFLTADTVSGSSSSLPS